MQFGVARWWGMAVLSKCYANAWKMQNVPFHGNYPCSIVARSQHSVHVHISHYMNVDYIIQIEPFIIVAACSIPFITFGDIVRFYWLVLVCAFKSDEWRAIVAYKNATRKFKFVAKLCCFGVWSVTKYRQIVYTKYLLLWITLEAAQQICNLCM